MNAYGMSIIFSIAISFVVTLSLGKVVIPFLRKLKYGQTILEIGPSWHKSKQGTPTMGGIMFIIGTTIATAICVPMYYYLSSMSGLQVMETPLMIAKIFGGLGMAIACGLTGFIDDYVKVKQKQNAGLTPKQKLILQFGIAFAYFLILHWVNSISGGESLTKVSIPFCGQLDFARLPIPFVGGTCNLSFIYWLVLSLVVVGIINAANLTDGVDGLSASIAFFIGIFYMFITNFMGMFGLSIESAALTGACLGFLFWNFHPAKVFMGDTGSLFLGGMACALGIGSGLQIPMIIISFVYIAEMFSVILQVLYFKATHGKRLFKMSPIHHHFEMCGWSEAKICTVFSLATIVLGIIATLMVIYS